MSLSNTSKQRPVLTIVLSATIVLFGVIGYYFLGVRDYPSVDPLIIVPVLTTGLLQLRTGQAVKVTEIEKSKQVAQ